MHIEYTLLNGYKKVLLLGFMFLYNYPLIILNTTLSTATVNCKRYTL